MKEDRKKELAAKVANEQREAALKSIWTLLRQYLSTLDIAMEDVESWGQSLKTSSEQSSFVAAETEDTYNRQQATVRRKKETDEARDVFLDRMATALMEMDPRFLALNSKLMSAVIVGMDPRSIRETFGPDGKLPRRKRIEILAQFADIIGEIHN